jgi:hypothetical protein
MTRFIHRVSLACLMPLLPLTASAGAAIQPNETTLRAADAEELRIILAGDVHAEQAFMHPNYIVNSPTNRIVRKDQRPSKDASWTSSCSKEAIGICWHDNRPSSTPPHSNDAALRRSTRLVHRC